MKIGRIIVIFFVILFIIGVGFLTYGFSDNGRLIRDYGMHSSRISDDEIKSIWCGMNDLPNWWHEEGDKEFCGNVEVEMDCKFTNAGDHCVITQEKEQ